MKPVALAVVACLLCFLTLGQASSTPTRTQAAEVYVSPGIYSAREPTPVAVVVAVDWPKRVELTGPSGPTQTSSPKFRMKRTGQSGNQQRFEVSVNPATWTKDFLEEHDFVVMAEGAQVGTFRLALAMVDGTLYLSNGRAKILAKQIESLRQKAAQKKQG